MSFHDDVEQALERSLARYAALGRKLIRALQQLRRHRRGLCVRCTEAFAKLRELLVFRHGASIR